MSVLVFLKLGNLKLYYTTCDLVGHCFREIPLPKQRNKKSMGWQKKKKTVGVGTISVVLLVS